MRKETPVVGYVARLEPKHHGRRGAELQVAKVDDLVGIAVKLKGFAQHTVDELLAVKPHLPALTRNIRRARAIGAELVKRQVQNKVVGVGKGVPQNAGGQTAAVTGIRNIANISGS